MIPGVIAKRYATALLELGTETGELDTLVEELVRAAEAYESSAELRAAFDAPLVPIQAKKAILGDIVAQLGLGTTAKNALGFLVDRRRIRALPAVAQRLREMADAKRGLLRAEVFTAMPLTEDYFEALQKQLERITGGKVVLDRKLDPALIGGVVARIGDTVYDGSLLARLRQMKDSLLPPN
jgi:F-type H+-transporting ATPase subunit delta